METNLTIRSITIEFAECEKSSVLKAIEDMITIAKLMTQSCHNIYATLDGILISVNNQSDIAEVYKKWSTDWHTMKSQKTNGYPKQPYKRGC